MMHPSILLFCLLSRRVLLRVSTLVPPWPRHFLLDVQVRDPLRIQKKIMSLLGTSDTRGGIAVLDRWSLTLNLWQWLTRRWDLGEYVWLHNVRRKECIVAWVKGGCEGGMVKKNFLAQSVALIKKNKQNKSMALECLHCSLHANQR